MQTIDRVRNGRMRSVHRAIFGRPPLAPLAETHALIAFADSFFGVSLAGSLFFHVSVDAARPRIVLYLLLTMAPFVVVAPLIGPVIDRVKGGQRLVVALTCAARAGVCFALANNLRTVLFYPLAFVLLVLGKTHSVAKNALVPRMADESETLVHANSRMARVATASGAIGGGIAAALLQWTTAPWLLRIGSALYFVAMLRAFRLPPPRPPRPHLIGLEYEQLHSSGLVLAASAMGVLRGCVGFLFFLLVFALKQAGEPTWFFGLLFAGSGLGAFVGTFVAPRARRAASEEMMLAAAMGGPAFLALVAAAGYGRTALIVVVFGEGLATSVGRRAFDSIVQRDAPDADRGRMFARFETRFQLNWVIGALLPVAVHLPAQPGLALVGGFLGLGAISYLTATIEARKRRNAKRGSEEHLPSELLAIAEGALQEGRYRLCIVQAAAAVDIARSDLREAGPSALALPLGAAALGQLHHLREAVVAKETEITRTAAEQALAVARSLLAGSPSAAEQSAR